MEPYKVSILALGDDKCGKSTFLSRIRGGSNGVRVTRLNKVPSRVNDKEQPFLHHLVQGPLRFQLEFSDTASPQDWRTLKPQIILLCFDVSERQSLVNIKDIWIKEVRKTFPDESNIPIVVVGLKRDLRPRDADDTFIPPNEAYQVAQAVRADRYIECSALNGDLLDIAYEDLLDVVAQTASEEGGQSSGGCAVM
ncbi:P-loop containing nucleoside triphosphate hydrolase protein [Cryphonectria parasitica EP155]|uniref:P-loop containing nucleoside triphosphate hydrolase protein n=1 Tax=Cryphonectria parasitica (strain ATCC 38755 / EP155) TaxID=660469 RepID=A0A9P5CPB5_CRYP1|nr:P-loop containing nucleoside triphosphate hydrolase protein [Cryphonectria parasitica EP155]KAF3766309.1 P-loop containing nucleoside triphosphate hydrolase protein [Cryphonectria parasitica EP155]